LHAFLDRVVTDRRGGCERFLDSYIQAKKPKEICAAASDDAALKKLIGENVAPRREK
jgi:hypothetical protein